MLNLQSAGCEELPEVTCLKTIFYEMRYTMQFLLIGFSMFSLNFCFQNSMNAEKVAKFESIVSGHCTTLLEHVIIMRISCFEPDLQMKLTTIPLVHCFEYLQTMKIHRGKQQ